ncbi:ATP-binding protein [Streptomyces sp. ISL-96]|uniref:ATP-binding protein n=1 Tax=Streptomyces sp. ISL-96 TaxID=2819191 RepID=UPI001BEBEFC5|nr:ATP-binding protein [Streptomyces sp. ISL-96]MBT2493429.1 ATP-binding protein [Streptomyces sp. ISL-96]
MSRNELIRPLSPTVAGAVTQPIVPPLLTTKEGWNASATRRLTPPDLQDCAPKGTAVGPLDPRMMYHGEMLPVITPALRRGLLDARRLLRTSRFRSVGRTMNMLIDGDRGTGKSTLLVQIGRGYQGLIEADFGPDPDRIPVIYINVPPERDNNLHWSLPFAEFLGLDHTLHRKDRTRRPTDMTEAITHVMNEASTQLVLIDGIDRIKDSEITAAFDYFEALQDRTRITFIFCGTGAREVVHRARYDDKRKNLPDAVKGKTYFSDLPVLWAEAIPYSDDWHRVVQAFEDDLRLYDHKPSTLLKLSRCLHRRTGGYIETLSYLICQAAQEAIETGTEAITKELLDDIRIGRGDSR